jgi:hypothetical protein
MRVLSYIVAVLAVFSGIAWAIESLSVTPAAQTLQAALVQRDSPKLARIEADSGGGGGALSPIYPATPGKELLAAHAQALASGKPLYKPVERHLAPQVRLQRKLAVRDDNASVALGYASEPAPMFNREVSY